MLRLRRLHTRKFSIPTEPPPICGDYIGELIKRKGRPAMQYEILLPHYDDLLRLAVSRCRTQADAEDLVADTMLAALTVLQRGGVIEHPRTWLANTLMHKINSAHRRAYRTPVVSYEALDDALCDGDPPFDDALAEADADEAAELRRALLYLARTSREVLIRHYYAGESVAAIARALGIPEGTVKSRLAAGRAQIRKGMETMEQKKNHIPATLDLNWGGTLGRNRAPASLVEGDLIAQNLLILAYPKPLTATELAQAIGIPTVYIEPILAKLVDGELMVQIKSDRYYTDFILYTPEDYTRRLPVQLDFVRDNFDALWAPLAVLTEKITALDFAADYTPQKRQKLVRFAVLRALQSFKESFIDRAQFDYPRRRDGGRWGAFGIAHPADMDHAAYRKVDEYHLGGERRSGGDCNLPGAESLLLLEYDTPFYDHPGRPGIVGWDAYFDHIHELLWCLHCGLDLTEAKIPNALIEAIPSFIVAGMLVREDDRLLPGIPVLSDDEFKAVRTLTNEASAALSATLSDAFRALMHRSAVQLPPHLTGVPAFRRHQPAIAAFELAAERAAWERGLHLQVTEGCYPAVVLVWE